MAVEDMQPDDVCQLLAKLFIPQVWRERSAALGGRRGVDCRDLGDCQHVDGVGMYQDKIERFIANGVSGKDLLDFSDEDLKGEDLQLTAIQVSGGEGARWEEGRGRGSEGARER
eukprot:3713736-Rhodomonas_salina.1